MFRSLRGIVFLLAAVLLSGMAACHINCSEYNGCELSIPAFTDGMEQDAFNPGRSATESVMEQNVSGAVTVTLNGYDSPRCQSSVKSNSLSGSVYSFIQTAAAHHHERLSGISRLADYYVYGLGHIII